MSACFGFGMVAGPVLGGLMGGFSPHAPFFAAGSLERLNFLTGCFLLPESHKGERRAVYAGRLSTRSLRSGGPGA
ncbi:Tetracycline efflux protein TetA (plasmid) [Shigella sonnei]|nr:Tetracycline efflux protein TetA [Shigella sonnei]